MDSVVNSSDKVAEAAIGSVVCALFPEYESVFAEEEEAVVDKETVVSSQALCHAVVVCTSLAGVGVTGDVEVRGSFSGGGGWMSCRLSGG